jgi:TRAP-type C4-dicarboxylate transport system substrate-binding protein
VRSNAVPKTGRGLKKGIQLLALALGMSAAIGGSAQTKLKFVHVYETSEPYHTAAQWAAGEIAKRTSDRYQNEVFAASALGKETDINQGLILGTVDIISMGPLFAGRTYGRLVIGGAPYMFRDFNHWKAYSTSTLVTELADGYRQKNAATRWSRSLTAASGT